MDARLLDDPRIRRRALAAHVSVLADTIQVDRDGSRDLGVLPPRILTPRTCREWADRLEAANAEGEFLSPQQWTA